MDRKLQWHRADSLRQHGFLVLGASKFVSSPYLNRMKNNSLRSLSMTTYKAEPRPDPKAIPLLITLKEDKKCTNLTC